jgi:hypothetical protein
MGGDGRISRATSESRQHHGSNQSGQSANQGHRPIKAAPAARSAVPLCERLLFHACWDGVEVAIKFCQTAYAVSHAHSSTQSLGVVKAVHEPNPVGCVDAYGTSQPYAAPRPVQPLLAAAYCWGQGGSASGRLATASDTSFCCLAPVRRAFDHPLLGKMLGRAGMFVSKKRLNLEMLFFRPFPCRVTVLTAYHGTLHSSRLITHA